MSVLCVCKCVTQTPPFRLAEISFLDKITGLVGKGYMLI